MFVHSILRKTFQNINLNLYFQYSEHQAPLVQKPPSKKPPINSKDEGEKVDELNIFDIRTITIIMSLCLPPEMFYNVHVF